MKTAARHNPSFTTRGVLNLLWVPAAAMLVTMAAFAQGNACDRLKATLAARIEATGVRGYSLEAVPAATPVPAGAKAIGSCEGGERKILYRRWGGASAPAPAESAAAPAPASVVAAEPPPKRPPPAVRPELPARTAPAPAPKPAPVPAPVPTPEPAKIPPGRPSDVDPVRQVAPTLTPAAQAPSAEPNPETPALAQRFSGLIGTHWHWLLGLLLVPLAALGWAWRAHHRAYDKNGLPRGPRL